MEYITEAKATTKSYFKSDYITNDNINDLLDQFLSTLEGKPEIKIIKLYKIVQVTGNDYIDSCRIAEEFFNFCIRKERQRLFKKFFSENQLYK